MTDQLGDSITIKALSPDGYDIMLCLREIDGKEPLFARTQKALAWFKENDYRPTGHSNGNGSQAHGEAPVCQYHGPMSRSKKFNGWYCKAKMGDGTYCKETVKD